MGETEDRKKKYDPLTAKLIRKKFPDQKIVVIGDHIYDVKVAEMLGCPFMGVLTGTTSKKELIKDIKVPYKIFKKIKKIKPKQILSILAS